MEPQQARRERLRLVEVQAARHEERIEDQERVMRALESHLKEIVDRLDRWRISVIVVSVLIFAGTDNGGKLLDTVFKTIL